jgi:hypothetical protein
MANLLRIKAEIIASSMSQAAADHAQRHLVAALVYARQQGALSWELQVATSLTRLLQRQGDPSAASTHLAPVYARFREGFETADMIAARGLLDMADVRL